MEWTFRSSCYDYEIVYRPGQQIGVADVLSRILSLTVNIGTRLKVIHAADPSDRIVVKIF